ncbi:MAG: glycosyltransferase [Gemmatimonadaceae bacterium]
MKALRRAGWGVTVVPEWEFIPLRWQGTALKIIGRALRAAAVTQFNRELTRQAVRWQPEMLLVFKGTFVQASTLKELRARGVSTYCFYPDVSFRVHGPHLADALPQYDWIFITKTFGLNDLREQLGVDRASVLLHAYDADVHRPLRLGDADVARFGCDASFIGTWSPKKERLLADLVQRSPDLRLRVWGEQWTGRKLPPLLQRCIGGHEVAGDDYPRAISASAINLGILSERRPGASAGDQITSRTFHIPACGGFMLHERTAELLEVFVEGRDVACFDGVDELARRVEEFLGAPERREAMAASSRAIVTPAHSWDSRIRVIIDHHARAGS